MSRYQLQLLLLSGAAIVLIVMSAFFADWFVIHVGSNEAQVDLRRIRECAPHCIDRDVATTTGMYPALSALAFWSALPLFVVIATQTGAKLLSGYAYHGLARFGMGLGAIVFFSAFGAGYLVAPEDANFVGFQLMTIERQWGPLLLVLGSLAGIVAVRYAVLDPHRGRASTDDGDSFQPVLPRHGESKDDLTRIPATPLSVKQLPMRPKSSTQQPARTTSPTTPPAVARTVPPTSGVDLVARARTSSSGPIDVSARLGGAPLDVAIRPPLPEAAPVPDDQIPVAPESGLVIRKRTTTAPPSDGTNLPLPPDIGVTIRTKPPSAAPTPMMASVASALGIARPAEPEPTTPAPSEPTGFTAAALAATVASAGRIKYAVTTAVFAGAGITASRTDGLSKLIRWTDIVGIVARRLPPTAPYDGLTFVDIVSSAGSTMRVLPTTKIVGHTLDGDHTERARTLVNVLASQALDAKLDSATKAFANGTSKAAQLKDEKTLGVHDERLK